MKQLSDFQVDQEIEGTVVGFTNFGVFVDIGYEKNGMIHISEIAERYVQEPRDFFNINDVIQCKVINIIAEKEQIKLSTKHIIK